MELNSMASEMMVGVPMVALLFAVFFRLDELIGLRPARPVRRPLAGGIDRNGLPIFVDPDGKPLHRNGQGWE